MANALAGKAVVIFGGSTGLGLATAQLAHAEAAVVTVVGRDKARLEAAQRSMPGSQWRTADVRDEAAVGAALSTLPQIDHVFVSVGLAGGANVLTSDMTALRQPFEERVFGTFTILRAALPKMKSGSLKLMSGLHASRPHAGASAQTAALSAVESLARTLCLDLAPIRVNAVAPGWIDTPRLDRSLGANKGARVHAIAATLPVKRIGRAEEVARVVLMLMTNEFMNGEIVHVDGAGRYA